MGCGSSMGDSSLHKQSTSPKKFHAIPEVSDNRLNVQSKQLVQSKNQIVENVHKNAENLPNSKDNDQTHSIVEDIKLDNQEQEYETSVNAVDRNKPKPTILYEFPVLKSPQIFLFGESAGERKIVSFNMENSKFEIISSRSQTSEPNTKYQPLDPIFESSQELMASHLYNKFSKPPYNFMFATYVTQELIFMCGGVSGSFDYISDESFFYKIKHTEKSQLCSLAPINLKNKGNSLLGLKFDKLEPMHKSRYSHMGVYFPIDGLGYIFVFGGRGAADDVLSECERYSIEQKKWIELSPMKVKRSTGFSLVFGSRIYVFGGYTSEKKRTKNIQVYDPVKNYWEVLDVKLHRGLQAGLIVSGKTNEILIMGGNVEFGALKSVIKVNLAEKTYSWDSNMKHQRFLQKGAKIDKDVFIFGGDFQDTVQKYSFKDRKWREQKIQYGQFISPQDINSFTMAAQTLLVKTDDGSSNAQQHQTKNANTGDHQKIHIFGTDQYPIILEINIAKWSLRKKAVPMTLRLRSHMGVTKVKQGKYFLGGGIDCYNQKCSKAAYLYYSGTNNAIEIAKMSIKKYEFAVCSLDQVIYIFGGRTDHSGEEILSSCEKYSSKNNAEGKWIDLPNLNRERYKAKTMIIGKNILVWGGQDALMTVNDIEILNTETDQLQLFHKQVPLSSEITAIGRLSQSKYQVNQPLQQIFIFSFNDLLKEAYCHSTMFDVEKELNSFAAVKQDNFLQGNSSSVLGITMELQLKQVNLKVTSFNGMFSLKNTFYFVTDKGMVSWEPVRQDNKGEEEKTVPKQTMKPQIVINQVEMLQYPMKTFSFPA